MQSVKQQLRPVVVSTVERAAAFARRHNWLTDVPAKTDATGEGAVDRFGLEGPSSLMHVLRGAALSTMPRIDGTMLSAGCAGSAYFQWIADEYGPVKRHIGLELYVSRPDDLPPWVDWIASSVANMQGVDDSSVELVFSGQNFEHLFGNDAVDFLLECHRVLQPGGWLVLDSPQREIASALTWTQPEHTIEFTPAEAEELVTLAGFDVVRTRGIWLCREPDTGEILPLWPDDGRPPRADEVARRTALGGAHPEHSFIWWLEVRRADREPQVEALRARHADIFAWAWPERLRRLHNAIGERHQRDGREVVSVAKGVAGYALFGPYAPLTPGHYRVSCTLRRMGEAGPDEPIATVEIAAGSGSILHARDVVAAAMPVGTWRVVDVEFDLQELTWGTQFRVLSTGTCALDVLFAAAVEESGTTVAPTP